MRGGEEVFQHRADSKSMFGWGNENGRTSKHFSDALLRNATGKLM